MKVEKFLKELRDSSERIFSIYTKGSCFRLYSILKIIEPSAKAYWSDIHSHAITEIGGSFYDIGGKLSKRYVEEEGYYQIPEKLLKGFYLLRYSEDENLNNSVIVQKYNK